MSAWDVVERTGRADGSVQAVLVCEHASRSIPPEFGDLGLAAADRYSHAVWDIGAAALTRALADRLGAPAVLGGVSRLVCDCNRLPDAADAMPERVERVAVPGNAGLSDVDRERRTRLVYDPFHAAVTEVLSAAPCAALVTVHSFTPEWNGRPRGVEIGYLHDSDASLAHAMLGAGQGGWGTRLNEPYSAADGVTHTLARHGPGRRNVMIEVRNDLLRAASGIGAMADHLAAALSGALGPVPEAQA